MAFVIMLKIKLPKPNAPIISPVILPVCSGNHSHEQMIGVQKHSATPIGVMHPYKKMKALNELTHIQIIIGKIVNTDPSAITCFGFHLYCKYEPNKFVKL